MSKWLLVFLFIVVACKKDNLDNYNPNQLGKSYAPIFVNSIYFYKVDSIFYNGFNNTIDTFSYEIKESVDSFFMDNLNEPVARIVIATRKSQLDKWFNFKSIYVKNNADYFERMEDNTRYMKLSFPLDLEKVWNANLRNTKKENLVFYTALNAPYKNDYVKTDSSITVEAESIHNPFEDYEYKEVYGKNVGLLYLRRINKFAQLNKKTGFQITYQLYDFQKK